MKLNDLIVEYKKDVRRKLANDTLECNSLLAHNIIFAMEELMYLVFAAEEEFEIKEEVSQYYAFSIERQMFWRSGCHGYTRSLSHAQLFSYSEAKAKSESQYDTDTKFVYFIED